MNNIFLIIQREYLSRVRKKSFLIMTLLTPFLMAGIVVVPTYLAMNSTEERNIAILDESNLLPVLEATDEITHFHYVEGNIDESIINQEVGLKIDWDRRYTLMRMHSSCHVLVSLVPALITGASVGIEKSRIDFDVDPSTLNKEEMNQRIKEIVSEDHPIFINQISGDEYEEYKYLSKGEAVSPPVINNKIRIVQIGDDNNIIDKEFCGGTHLKSTKEIGPLEIGKIENKGKRNRRINIRFSS